MTGPKRIQLRRTRGWRMPEGALKVARPSRWGNPYRVGDEITVSVTGHSHGADFAFEEVPERLTDMIEACQQTLEVLEPIRPTGAPS